MTVATIDDLVRAASGLNRASVGYLAAVVGSFAWSIYVPSQPEAQTFDLFIVSFTILVVAFALFVWYAFAAGGAAKALGGTAWRYAAWVVAAPLIALLAIPFVSSLVAVSPLCIKFVLGGQLQAAIREQGLVHFA